MEYEYNGNRLVLLGAVTYKAGASLLDEISFVLRHRMEGDYCNQ
jgi:hypothetical protein